MNCLLKYVIGCIIVFFVFPKFSSADSWIAKDITFKALLLAGKTLTSYENSVLTDFAHSVSRILNEACSCIFAQKELEEVVHFKKGINIFYTVNIFGKLEATSYEVVDYWGGSITLIWQTWEVLDTH